jgi:hypothetical protein
MNIIQNLKRRNKIYVPIRGVPCFSEGNELLPCWYHCNGCQQNRSNLAESTVLNELILLSHSLADTSGNFELKNCFAYFGKRFGISKLQMQKDSCYLGNLGLVSRVFREVIIDEDMVFKELDLTLHTDRLNAFLEEEID